MKPARLDQILSRYGYCSRSEARLWLRRGRVATRSGLATSPDAKSDPAEVTVDGAPIDFPEGILVALHKPAGYVCSHDPGEGQRVYDLLPSQWIRRNPPVTSIGRLDKDATGLLLLTDVGALVHRWTSPNRGIPKVYEVETDRPMDSCWVGLFASGDLVLPEETEPCRPAVLEITGLRTARLELHEGRYHQVKRMFASQGAQVVRLHRSRFGPYTVDSIPAGQWQALPLPA